MRELKQGEKVWVQIGGINRQMKIVEVNNQNVTFEHGTTRIVTERRNVFPANNSDEILTISDLVD